MQFHAGQSYIHLLQIRHTCQRQSFLNESGEVMVRFVNRQELNNQRCIDLQELNCDNAYSMPLHKCH